MVSTPIEQIVYSDALNVKVMPMSDGPKNTGNQVSRNSNGKYFVFWRGVVVNDANDRVREFETDREAQNFLVHCDAVGQVVE